MSAVRQLMIQLLAIGIVLIPALGPVCCAQSTRDAASNSAEDPGPGAARTSDNGMPAPDGPEKSSGDLAAGSASIASWIPEGFREQVGCRAGTD